MDPTRVTAAVPTPSHPLQIPLPWRSTASAPITGRPGIKQDKAETKNRPTLRAKTLAKWPTFFRKPTEKATLRSGYGHLPGQHTPPCTHGRSYVYTLPLDVPSDWILCRNRITYLPRGTPASSVVRQTD